MKSVVLIALGFLVAEPAFAYVCTRVGEDSGPSLSWFTRQPIYTFFAGGTADIAGDAELDVIRDSFSAWEDLQACVAPNNVTDLYFLEAESTTDIDGIGWNFAAPETNSNLIIFRDDDWPHPAQAGIIALTTTTFVPLTGEIFDADIEFNSADFRFAVDGAAPKQCDTSPVDCDCPAATAPCLEPPMDLMNVAVHEIGHFFGLAHSGIQDATMFAQASAREDEKRTPECDDKNGVVFKYPSDAANGYCDPNVAGCTCAPPDTLDRDPSIRPTDEDNGLGDDGGCAAFAPSGFGVLLAALALMRRTTRRPRALDRF